MASHTLARRQGVPSFVRFLNPLIHRLIRAGMPMGPNSLLTVRGRKSGRPLTVPIAVLEVDGRHYVQSPFGEVNWVHNLRATPEATVRVGRRDEPVIAAELPPEEAAQLLRRALSPYLAMRMGRAFLGRYYDLNQHSTDADYLREARLHPVFELRPAQQA